MKRISLCNKCNLCKFQTPLIDNTIDSNVMVVGLSAKIKKDADEKPLSINTPSGRIISELESKSGISFYKTNLVKCVPLTRENKLRYPNESEKESCYENIKIELQNIKPKILVLLGKDVLSFFIKKLGLSINKEKFNNDYNYSLIKNNKFYLLPVHHPSFINVYRRKYIDQYISSIHGIIRKVLITEL